MGTRILLRAERDGKTQCLKTKKKKKKKEVAVHNTRLGAETFCSVHTWLD
jgi:hypothetical protein